MPRKSSRRTVRRPLKAPTSRRPAASFVPVCAVPLTDIAPGEAWVATAPLALKTGKKSTTLTTNVLLRCVFRRRHALLEAMVASTQRIGCFCAGKVSITVQVNWGKGHPIDVDGASIAAKAVIDAMVRRGYLRGDGPKDVVEVRFVAGAACDAPWIRVSATEVTPKS